MNAQEREQDRALRAYVETSPLEPDPQAVEEEARLLLLEARHRAAYGSLMGLRPSEDGAELSALREEAARRVKTERVLKALIKEQGFQVSREELETEAREMARRQDVSLDMVKGLFGEDLALLVNDLLERKALAYICAQGKGDPDSRL